MQEKAMETSTLSPNSTSSSVRAAVNSAILSVSKYPREGANGNRGTVLLSKGKFTASAFIVRRSGVTLEGTLENGKSVTTICTESRSDPVTIKILESQAGIKNLNLDGKRKTEDTVTGEPRKSSSHPSDGCFFGRDFIGSYFVNSLLRR